jgi:quinol monooxygenase YgiN
MYGIVATINIKPEFKQQFMQAMLEDARGSNQDEPGCLRFDVLQDADDPNRIHLMEEYVDEAAFQAHTKQPHFLQWRNKARDWFASPAQVHRVSSIYPPS